jgi:hypothetical protein
VLLEVAVELSGGGLDCQSRFSHEV